MTRMVKNAEVVTVYKDLTRYTCQVGATQLQNGDLVVIFNEMRGLFHLDFDSIALVRSTDNGRTWDPKTKVSVWPCTHHFGSDTPSIEQLSDGTLLVNFLMTTFVEQKGILEDFGPQSERLFHTRELDGAWLTKSTDNGYSWEPAYKASTAPLRWGQPKDQVVELPNGSLLMAVQAQKIARNYQEDVETSRCSLLRSDNQGLDWEHYSTIAYDPAGIISFEEPALGRTADGKVIAMLRTKHQPRDRHQKLWIAYSDNEGESWSQPKPTELWGYPADLTLLQDGRMLCTYSYRRDPWGVRACISNDGITWKEEDIIVLREGGIAPPSKIDWYWHIGYPTTVQLNDGTLFTVFHEWTQEEPHLQYVLAVRWELD